MPLSPLWANLPKRHCDDCNKLFKPVKPSRPGEHYFCSDNCRKSYHKHGGAYRKLKEEMRKMVDRRFRDPEFYRDLEQRFREIIREEIAAHAAYVADLERVRLGDERPANGNPGTVMGNAAAAIRRAR